MDKTVEVSQAAVEPAKVGLLNPMVAEQINREGRMSSFMVRAGLLQDILDELYDHRAYRNTRATQPEAALREALPKTIGRLELGEHLSSEHYCGGSHDMPDGQPVYWQERGGEHPDDIDGYCLSCAIEQAESDAGWCECSIQAALKDHRHG